jgi:hypothetical protein
VLPDRDAAGIAAHVLVGRLGPLEQQVELGPVLVVLARDRERRIVHGRAFDPRDLFDTRRALPDAQTRAAVWLPRPVLERL